MRTIQIFSSEPGTLAIDPENARQQKMGFLGTTPPPPAGEPLLLESLKKDGAPSHWERETSYLAVGNVTARGFLWPAAGDRASRVHLESKTRAGTTERAFRAFTKKPSLPVALRKRVAAAQSLYNLSTDWLSTPERERYLDAIVLAIASATKGIICTTLDSKEVAWDVDAYRAARCGQGQAAPDARAAQGPLGDAALIVRAIALAAWVEGPPSDAALAVIEACGAVMPELCTKNTQVLVKNDRERVAKLGAEAAIAAMQGPHKEAVRLRAFHAAVNLLLVGDASSDARDELATRLQAALRVSPESARKIIEVLAQKQAHALFGAQE